MRSEAPVAGEAAGAARHDAAPPLRLATRGSALALAQASLVRGALSAAAPGVEVELVTVRTSGDEGARAGAGAPADKSRFVKEIEEALIEGRSDVAVHSAKDLPGELHEGLVIVGVSERADARDAICGAGSVEELPRGAVVGTSSLRRRSQLLARRPDLRVEELRGNVDTRLRRLRSGSYDAIVLAAAGLERLGAADGAPIPVEELTPAAGQGALALEARAGDERAEALGGRLTHPESQARLAAERTLVGALGATCRTPVAAFAEVGPAGMELAAFVGLPDGSMWIRDALRGEAARPVELGREVAERLLAAGAEEVLAAAERWV